MLAFGGGVRVEPGGVSVGWEPLRGVPAVASAYAGSGGTNGRGNAVGATGGVAGMVFGRLGLSGEASMVVAFVFIVALNALAYPQFAAGMACGALIWHGMRRL